MKVENILRGKDPKVKHFQALQVKLPPQDIACYD